VTDPARPRILVVGPSWVGDMVMAQTLFADLQARQPCHIDVLAPAWCRPLLSRMPEVRQALDLPFGHGELKLRQRRAEGRALRGRYDHAYVVMQRMGEHVDLGVAPGNQLTIQPDNTVSISHGHGGSSPKSKWPRPRGLDRTSSSRRQASANHWSQIARTPSRRSRNSVSSTMDFSLRSEAR